MLNRQQRRAEGRRAAKMEERCAKHPEDAAAYKAGFDSGFRRAMGFTWRMCFASVAVALHELEGYGPTRATRFLRRLDELMNTTMTCDEAIDEAIDEALEKAGVALDFDAVFTDERIMKG